MVSAPGIGANAFSTASSAYVAEPLPKTRSPTATPDHAVTHLVDDAGRLERRGRGRRSSGIASVSIPERTFQSNGLTPDASTAIRTCPGTGVRVGCVADVQDAGVAVLLELDCAHGRLLEIGVFAGTTTATVPDLPRAGRRRR